MTFARCEQQEQQLVLHLPLEVDTSRSGAEHSATAGDLVVHMPRARPLSRPDTTVSRANG